MSPDVLVQRNVVALPGSGVSSRAVLLSRELEQYGTEFVLGREGMPHVSLYQAAYPPHQEHELLARVRQVAISTAPFDIIMMGMSSFWGTFIFWDVTETSDLKSLHTRLLEQLNPLREGKLLPIHEEILADESVPQGLRDSIRQYGSPLCGGEERPHLTLTRLKDVRLVPRVLEVLASEPPGLRFTVRELYLANVGPHGTCPKMIRAFPLVERA